MPGPQAPRTDNAAGNFTHIGNKMKRQDLYRQHRKTKKQEKLKRRMSQAKEERQGEDGAEKKRTRLAANIPRSIENTRAYNPTIIAAPNTHSGPEPSAEASTSADAAAAAAAADGDDEEREGMDDVDGDVDEQDNEEDPYAPPALLITTSLPHNSTSPHLSSANARSHPAERVRQFVDELLNIFPGAEYRQRAKAKGVGLGKIAGWARDRGYDAMLVVGEDKKEPFSLTIIGLPQGPTAFFRLTNISIKTEIEGHARSTGHTPELILNNFTTTLGHDVGTLLQSLFPRIPQLEGRQVVTAHNQRDYIFFRRHRYMFASEERAKLQEIGPRFTLKLRSLKPGLPKGSGVWDGEVHFEGRPRGHAPAEAADAADEAAAAAEMEGGGGDDAGAPLSSTSAPKKRRRTQRQDEEQTGYTFEWKPKMSVSRRNFYL